jgi:maleate cis-trans isomerase
MVVQFALMTQQAPRYKVGSISARSDERRVERESIGNVNMRSERLVPRDIVYINAGLDIPDYTPEGVQEGFSRYWACVDKVMEQKPDRIGWGGFPLSPQLGRPKCLELIQETAKRTGVRAGSDVESIVAALKHMGTGRVAIASRWAGALNHATVRYMEHAGIEVLAITSAGQMVTQADAMSLDAGIKMVFHLARQAMKEAPRAEALIVPGGAWRSLGCLPVLEEDFNIPVISNGTAQVWSLVHDGVAPPLKGWTRLLETP